MNTKPVLAATVAAVCIAVLATSLSMRLGHRDIRPPAKAAVPSPAPQVTAPPASEAPEALSSASPLALTPGDLRMVSHFPSQAEKEFWKVAVKPIWLRPPCCGACQALKQKDFKVLARVLKTAARDTPENRKTWSEFNTILLGALKRQELSLYKRYVTLRQTELRKGGPS